LSQAIPPGAIDCVICRSVLDHMPLVHARQVIQEIYKVLRPKGIAWLTFDGNEPEDPQNFVRLEDGTRFYQKGPRKGMLWRYFTDEEILKLVRDFTVLKFEIRKDGQRSLWLRKDS